MNYRHGFHAGNFEDVMKHAVLAALFQGMQRKEKGFLYVDTHAGRGGYDLEGTERGDSLERKAEWPEGIGRLVEAPVLRSAVLGELLELVKRFDKMAGHVGSGVRFYPGSPWVGRLLAREQDRVALCELNAGECEALKGEFARERGVSVQCVDGYAGMRGLLPPAEKRALVLIDPPFEAEGEFGRVLGALKEGLRRMQGATFAVWYPLTERAGRDEFLRNCG